MTERRAQDPPSQRDAEITLLLQDVAVPDHRHGFWDDLARQMEQTDQLSRIGTALGDHEAGADAEPAPAPELAPSGPRSIAPLAWRLLAAAVVLALVGGVALLRSDPDDGRRVDSGVTTADETEGADPEPASTGDPATTSTVRGERSWLFADEIVWIGDEFVTSALGDSYWTSPDGIEWKRREGPSPVMHRSLDCPQELTCAVTPEAPPIPFHFFGESLTTGLDRAGDVVLLEATGGYSIERLPNPEVQQPDLNPALLAVAAQSDPCFAELARQDPVETAGSPARDQAYLSSWSGGGLSNPVITLTCVQDSDSALFELDLRDHLDDAQLLDLFSGHQELWVESPGSPPQRVDDFPTTSFWIDSVVGGELSTSMSPVSSSGDRFWAVDEGTLVSSTNGTDWTAHEVPTAGSDIDQVAASPGGHLALWLVEDRRVWHEEGHVIVSHDAGSTWSEPVPITAYVHGLSVGPAGAAVPSQIDDGQVLTTTVTIVTGDRSSEVTLQDAPQHAVNVAVAADRVLVQQRRIEARMDVYGLDGALLHRTTWVEESDGGLDLLWSLVVAVAVALTLVTLGRRRRNREAAPQLH